MTPAVTPADAYDMLLSRTIQAGGYWGSHSWSVFFRIPLGDFHRFVDRQTHFRIYAIELIFDDGSIDQAGASGMNVCTYTMILVWTA